VVSSALTSRFARQEKSGPAPSLSWLRRASGVFLLGIARVCAVRATNYHEHASEYGLHWNFFLSLAAVWVLAEAAHAVARVPARSALVGVLLAGAHQWLLLQKGVVDFMFSAPRVGFLSANREGLASVSGSLSVYLVGEGLAWACRSGDKAARVRRLATASAASWLIWGCCSACVQETSRRLSNAAYGALALAVAYTVLFAFQLVSTVAPVPRTPVVRLLRAMREHALKVFLAGNVLTGAVNHTVRTLQQGPGAALAMIFGYVLLLSALAYSL